MSKLIIRQLIAEFTGTFILASVILNSMSGPAFPIATPVIAGLTLTLLVYLLGGISGCQINPAITFGLMVTRKTPFKTASCYILVQVAAGVTAFLFVSAYGSDGLQNINLDYTLSSSIGEIVGMAFFGFGVASVLNSGISRELSGISVGMSLFIGIIIAHHYSMGVLNPAVAIAGHIWSIFYLLFPLIGSTIGMLVSNTIFQLERE
ncbi:aquaporin [Aquella oligotrophica]|uniref:Aquaporin n=1 Tax=Aquella oligotrophica TaxID=2067065 RepID=A0A2I7N5Z6_9NEIS|nr:aquaporin [Aquella oligotrophica]AUR51879.1 hypothetical protein CUN60_06070 [Aquella oligotrophica]